MPQWITDLINVAPWLAAFCFAGFALWKVWPLIRKLGHLVDDLMGESERPGVPARPGIVEAVSLLRDDVDKVKQQVKNSHSTNLRDDVDKVMADLESLHSKLDGHLTTPQTTINVNSPEARS